MNTDKYNRNKDDKDEDFIIDTINNEILRDAMLEQNDFIDFEETNNDDDV